MSRFSDEGELTPRASHHTHLPRTTINLQNDDEVVLASLGYKQELRRAYSTWELFGLGLSLIGVFPSISSVLVYAIPNGGPAAMIWGWTVCTVFLVIIALALAELGSAAPTAGGLYYWTHMYSSPRYKNVLSWIVGYANAIGYIAGMTGVDYGCAVQVMAAVSIGSDLTFVPTSGQTFGVFAVILFFHGIVCGMPSTYVARLQNFYILFNVLLCLAIIVGVPVATPKEFRNTAKFAFGGFTNFNGWADGYAFVLSFIAPLWTINGFDASVHISEEASNARFAVPWALMMAVIASSILGWGINVALAFNMGTDMESILTSPIGQPMAAILFNSFGRKGTLAVWAVVVVTQFMVGMGGGICASRQIFAFSRDGALPFSSLLRQINPHTQTPINAVWFAVCIALLLGLLSFAGPVAIGAIFSLGIAGLYLAYLIPIAARWLGGEEFKPGPFSLGIFSLPISIVAVLWMTFMLIIFCFPTTPTPTVTDMNYTCLMLGGLIFCSLSYYYCPKYGGRYWFTGPVVTIENATSDMEGEERIDMHAVDLLEKD